jgi:hypothetical protein
MKINKGDNTGFFKDGFFSMMIKLRKDQWVGEPKKDSSRTTFQLSMTDYNQEFLTENCVINGLVEPKKSYYRLIYDRIN